MARTAVIMTIRDVGGQDRLRRLWSYYSVHELCAIVVVHCAEIGDMRDPADRSRHQYE